MTDVRANLSDLSRPERANGLATAQSDAGRSGVLDGTAVHVVDQASLLADAAEELTAQLSEKSEKELSERDVEAGRREESLERVLKVAEVDRLLKSLGDLDKRDLFRGLKALLQRQDGRSGCREQARQEYGEPSHQYAALVALVEALKARGAMPAQISEAEAARDDLMEERGDEIRAALNIGDAAGAAALNGLATRQELRDAYRDSVSDYADMGSVLTAMTEKFGPDKLPDAIAFMTRALGADLAADGSSVEKAKLATIVADLQRIEILATMLGKADAVAARARQKGAGRKTTGAALLKNVVTLLDARSARPSEINRMLNATGMRDTEARINFLTDFRLLMDAAPVRAFASPEARFKVLDAVQHSLDDAIAIEEREEEA